jgi:hypothetical protein
MTIKTNVVHNTLIQKQLQVHLACLVIVNCQNLYVTLAYRLFFFWRLSRDKHLSLYGAQLFCHTFKNWQTAANL